MREAGIEAQARSRWRPLRDTIRPCQPLLDEEMLAHQIKAQALSAVPIARQPRTKRRLRLSAVHSRPLSLRRHVR